MIDVRPGTARVPARQAGLAWPRLPAVAELATIGAGYAAYSLVRLAIRAGHQVAFTHAAQLWQAERQLHVTAEPYLNHLAAGHLMLAQAAGYYYGLLHFLVTPLVLAWLYLRRPAAFPRLRSALVLATAAATAVFWAWPVAPPRFSVPGMTDIMVVHDILSAAHPRGATSLVNLYAAMPSLHVAWAAWCALAIATATRGRRRHLAWLYPAATTLVVLASANHFLLDAAGGLAVAGLGMLAASAHAHLPAWHAPAGRSQPAVSCSPELRGRTQPCTTAGLWMAADGMWAAATMGLYTVTDARWVPQRGTAAAAADISAGCVAQQHSTITSPAGPVPVNSGKATLTLASSSRR
jgi:PAP2 superfamily protein